MVFGIDLGTTNSLIGNGDNLYSGLVSSNVDMSTMKQVPHNVISKDVVGSYKADMTTGSSGETARTCSTVVLQELAQQATMRSGMPCKDVVISVPAKFSTTQRQAVKNSAKAAGLNCLSLINEPTAAAIYACKNIRKCVLVYDLGGGTFDVTALDSRCGSYMVIATDGLILAGDDFDKDILNNAFNELHVPLYLRGSLNKKKMLYEVAQAKVRVQKTGQTQQIDFNLIGFDGVYDLTVEKYKSIMRVTFFPTLQLAEKVLSCITYETDPVLVFAGGSTACPYLREWITSYLHLKVDTYDCPPDFIVAKGVALYAKMIEDGTAETEVDDVTKRLSIEDSTGQGITIIEENSNIPITGSQIVWNPKATDNLLLKVYQGNALMQKDNDYIGTLEYKYGRMMQPQEGYVSVEITVDRDGIVSVVATDLLTSEQQMITLRLLEE